MLAVAALALVATALAAPVVGAAWRQSTFVIGGYGVGGDPQSLIQLNDAGVSLAVPSDNSSPQQARRIAARFDSLHLHHSGFRMFEIACEETRPPGTLAKNPDPVANRAAILGELGPSGGLNNTSVVGWYLWDEPPLYYPPERRLPPDRVFGGIHEMTRRRMRPRRTKSSHSSTCSRSKPTLGSNLHVAATLSLRTAAIWISTSRRSTPILSQPLSSHSTSIPSKFPAPTSASTSSSSQSSGTRLLSTAGPTTTSRSGQ